MNFRMNETQSGSSDTPTVGCSDGNVGLVLGLREVESMVTSFNPDELSCPEAGEWLTSTEKTCLRYHMTEDQMMIIAGMRLKGAAKLWFEAMKGELNTWNDLKEQLKIYFPKVVNIPQINRQLERKKKPEETAETYVYEKLRLAKRAGTSDAALMQYVIEGIPNSSQRDILKSKDIKTIPELAEAIGKLEAPEKSSQKQYTSERRDKVLTEKGEDRGRSRSRWRDDSDARKRSRNEDYEDRRPQHWRKSQSRHSGSRKDYKHDQRNECQGEVSTKREKDSSTPQKAAKDSQKTQKRLCYICRSEEHLAARCPKNKDFRVRLVGAVASRKTNNELLVKIGKKGEVIDAIMDTGSDITIVKDSNMAALGIPLEGNPVKFKSFGGKEGITRGFANIQLSVEDVTKTMRVHVVPDNYMTVSMILGKDFFNDDDVEGTISSSGVAIKRKRTSTAAVNQINKPMNKRERYCSPIRAEELQVGKAARDDDVKKLIKLVNVYRKCFAKNISELGKSSVVTMNVEVKENKIIRYAPYRIPIHYKKDVDAGLKLLLDNGIIEPSNSEFASPMVVQTKKGGELRICVDYRLLNSILRKEHHPMPNIEEEIQKLQGRRVFSSLDLMMGYHQLMVDPDSRKYLAFVTPEAQYTYTRVPFGLATSPAVFMRAMDKVLAPMDRRNITCFVDDVLISTDTIEENLDVIKQFLVELEKHGLTVKVSKCEFFKSNITFLGHEIDGTGVTPGSVKTKAITDFERPDTQRKMRQFLGLTGYFRKFVPGFAQITQPLRAALVGSKDSKSNEMIEWTPELQKAFEELKGKLVDKPILELYSPSAEHELHCDASKWGLGGALMQRDKKGDLKPVAYFSRATSKVESQYSSYELETLAVVESLERFRYYLLGKHFKVVTDCRALQLSHTSQTLIPRIARWWLKIMAYDFTMVHRAGNKMAHVDCLSRAPVEPPVEKDEVIILSVGLENDDWIAASQLRDPVISRIREALKGESQDQKDTKHLKEQYELIEDRVHKKTPAGSRFYVPKGLRFYVMRAAHDDMGHPALERTLKTLRKTYWFPKMQSMVTKYLKNCVKCCVNKRGPDENTHQLYVMKKTDVPFHTLHIDFCGPFAKVGNKEHVCGIIDAFTRFTVLRPVSSPSSRSAISAIVEISQFFGMPSQIVSDNGTAFTSKEYRSFCSENNIKISTVAVATPRANGQIERVFRVVKDSLRCLSDDDAGKDWVKNLPTVQWSLNALENRVIGESPQKVLLGYTPNNVLKNQLLSAVTAAIEREEEDVITLPNLREEVWQRMYKDQCKQAEKYNEVHRGPRKYSKGDLVLLKYNPQATGSSRKLMPRFRGPYEVQKVLDRDRYLIADTAVTQITQKRFPPTVYSAEKLKPWGDPAELAVLEEGCLESGSESSDEN